VALFRFKVLTEDGKVETGLVDLPFDDPVAAMRYLEKAGGIALDVRALPEPVSRGVRFFKIGLGSVSRLDLAEFFNNMAMLVGAGVPVLSALEEILDDIRVPRLRNTIQFICTDIENGQTFSEAVEKHERLFPFVVRHMIAIGEETGNLDGMLRKAADHLLHIHEIVSGTKRAFMYPSFLLVVVFLAVVFWFWYVVPQLVSLFLDLGIDLPAPTRILLIVSDWFQEWFLLFMLGLSFSVVLLGVLRRYSSRVRYGVSYLALQTPVLNSILKTSIVARATEYMGIMIGAGLGVLRSLELVTNATGNEVFKRRLAAVQNSIKAGSTLSVSLRRHQALDPFAVRMIAVGEMTGKLDDQTAYVANLYREKLNGLVQVLSKTLEPIIMTFLGVMFAVIIAGLLLPVYDLISQIGM
jgi:type II secretory pathway component PulF